jgi:IclR family mhp operon transcriptional activator
VLATSLGRAFLAFCSDEERARTLARMTKTANPWNALAHQPRKLNKLLDEVRRQGFGVMDEEYSGRVYSGAVWAMAVPIRKSAEVFGAMNIMMLSSVVSREEGLRKYLRPLQDAADELAAALDRGRLEQITDLDRKPDANTASAPGRRGARHSRKPRGRAAS